MTRPDVVPVLAVGFPVATTGAVLVGIAAKWPGAVVLPLVSLTVGYVVSGTWSYARHKRLMREQDERWAREDADEAAARAVAWLRSGQAVQYLGGVAGNKPPPPPPPDKG